MGVFSRLFGRSKQSADVATRPVKKPRAVRRFNAARPDRLVSGFSGFGSSRTIHDDVREGLRGLVAHSRQQSQNNDYLKAFYSHVRRNVVGRKGLVIKPTARFKNGKLDRVVNTAIYEAHKEWSRRGNCTTCGKLTFRDVQRIAITTAARDGNFLARKYMGPEYGPNGFQLQLLDINMLDIELEKDLGGGRYITCGIEFSELDRPVAYHIWKANPVHAGMNRERLRIPANEIVHLFLPYDQTNAVLGVPWAHTALRRLNLMAGYEEAALANAKYGASKMGFFTKDQSAEDEEEILESQDAGEASESDLPDIEEIEAGILETLPIGYDFKAFDPAYPNGEIKEFVKIMLRGASAGLDVAYSSFANDLEGANFSSLRAGQGEEREQWQLLQDWFGDHFCELIRPDWLRMSMLTGALALPFERFDKFNNADWTARGWRSVNPKDDATSNDTDLKNLIKSPQEIVAERGRTFEEVLDEFQEAREMAAERKIDLMSALSGAAPQAEPPQDETTED